MLNRIAFAVFLAVFFTASAAFAISDADFNALIASSPEFKAEDQKLGKIYKSLMSELKGDDKNLIRNSQRKWLKSELDAEAKGYMAEGMSKAQAYTKAFHVRFNQLRVVLENSRLSEEDKAAGRAKPDDFYNDSEDIEGEEQWPDNCGLVKAAVPIDDSLRMILLEGQNGEKRTFYYYHQPDNYGTDCGKIVGLMCFQVLQELPVTPKLRQSGVKGDKMTLIHECVAAN